MKLEARGITVEARGCSIVADASLSVSSGEMVGLIGPNGAGKSTLLKAILGVRPLHAGVAMLDGVDLFSLPARERARQIAFLPQERRVEWRLPAHDIIMLGRFPHHSGFSGTTEEDQQAVARAIDAVGGEELLDRPVAVLSGGERSRILLARALAVEAPILLADEPTNALDPYHQLHVMEILRKLADRGVGVLAVIHDLALAARFMDRLVLMDRGAVITEGPPAEVLAPNFLSAVYGVDALRGDVEGRSWVLPWSRTSDRRGQMANSA